MEHQTSSIEGLVMAFTVIVLPILVVLAALKGKDK